MSVHPAEVVIMVAKERERYYKHRLDGAKMHVHELCVQEALPCGVLFGEDCPICYDDSLRIAAGMRHDANCLPSDVMTAIVLLDAKRASSGCEEREEDI
ncbi:hypothetical protein PR002_g12006 [Phytophthora rubi]|nr:hypothetical protein PR002_g12006 [Phytophthora rubi]